MGGTVTMKGTPRVTCTQHTTLLFRRPHPHERVMVPITAQIHRIPAHIFWEIAQHALFGWIWHNMAKKCTLTDAFGWPIICRMA